MVLAKTVFVLLGLSLASARSFLPLDPQGYYFIEEADFQNDLEDAYELPSHVRIARQAGSISSNPDGSLNVNGKIPLVHNDKNVLSVIGAGQGLDAGKYKSATGGLALDNINGHGLSLTQTHVPNFGDQLTAAGRVNLVNTPDHNLNANAFVSKTMPNNPNIPDFSTHGANLDYLFQNKVGASVGVAHTPVFQKTDYSLNGNLNLFKNPTSSLDFNAGASKSVSPFIPNSRWEPTAGLRFTRFW